MFYEVFIPSTAEEGFDVTMTVEADNWMTALKSGLERTGEGADSIRNVMCDIKEDNTIHVTDGGTRRVFVLREVGDEGEESGPEVVPPEPEPQSHQVDAVSSEQPPAESPPRFDEDYASREPTAPRHQQTAPPPPGASAPRPQKNETPEPLESRDTTKFTRGGTNRGTQAPPSGARPPTGQVDAATPAERSAPEPVEANPAAPEPSEPETSIDEISDPLAEEHAGLNETSWTSEDGRMRIGSSTFEALQKDEPEPKVVRETRAPSGQREAIDIGRATEAVSQNTLEEVFLEIQQIHEQGMSMEEVINFVMDLSMEKVNAEAGSIMFADVNGRELYFATARGPKAHQVMDFRVPMGKGIVGFCAREGVSLAISDAENDPRFYKAISEAIGYETKNLACAPVQFEGRVYGVIELMNKSSAFTNTEVNVLTYVGRQLAKFVHDLIMAREKLE